MYDYFTLFRYFTLSDSESIGPSFLLDKYIINCSYCAYCSGLWLYYSMQDTQDVHLLDTPITDLVKGQIHLLSTIL